MLKSPMLSGPKQLSSFLLNRSQTLLTSTSSSATNFGQGILDSLSDFTSLDFQEGQEDDDEVQFCIPTTETFLKAIVVPVD
jgi:hypothetical protein